MMCNHKKAAIQLDSGSKLQREWWRRNKKQAYIIIIIIISYLLRRGAWG